MNRRGKNLLVRAKFIKKFRFDLNCFTAQIQKRNRDTNNYWICGQFQVAHDETKHPKMDHSQEESKYYRVENWCREQISNGSEFLFEPVLFEGAMKATSESFDFPLASLTSLFRNIYDKHIKSTSHQVQALLQTKLVQEYLAGKSIKNIAKEINFSPAMLARRVVEEMTELAGKKKLSTAMKNPLEELGTIAVIKQKYQISETDLQEEW